jgi:hypothetical protein
MKLNISAEANIREVNSRERQEKNILPSFPISITIMYSEISEEEKNVFENGLLICKLHFIFIHKYQNF